MFKRKLKRHLDVLQLFLHGLLQHIHLPCIINTFTCHASSTHSPATHHQHIHMPCIINTFTCHASSTHSPAMHHQHIHLPCIINTFTCHASLTHSPAMHHQRIHLPCIIINIISLCNIHIIHLSHLIPLLPQPSLTWFFICTDSLVTSSYCLFNSSTYSWSFCCNIW